MTGIERILPERRKGSEPFRDGERDLGISLLSFWRWSTSDIISNSTRGVLAEYLVATAVGADQGLRDEWAAVDLTDPSGITIEVKSAAFIQSWYQKHLSAISFRCSKTLAWDPETNRRAMESRRQAQVYVFALLANQDPRTLDPLDVSQWEFYVLPTAILDQRRRSQHSITLKSLRALHGDALSYRQLADAIGRAAAANAAATGAHAR